MPETSLRIGNEPVALVRKNVAPANISAGPSGRRLGRTVTKDKSLEYALPMTNKRLRAIAALEVELAMTEAHAEKLSIVAPGAADPERQQAMAALAKEENDRAETLRQQIHLLQDQI